MTWSAPQTGEKSKLHGQLPKEGLKSGTPQGPLLATSILPHSLNLHKFW